MVGSHRWNSAPSFGTCIRTIHILDNNFSVQFLVVILFLKLFVTVICLGMGFFGGVYSPALVLGAAIVEVFTYLGNSLGVMDLEIP